MRIYTGENVFEAAQKRVAYIFDEFEHPIVGMSGGKDSTCVFELCMAEATKRGRLPLEVLFIDQEVEWQHTIDYVKSIMYDPRVKPYWLQVPIRETNGTSQTEHYLYNWREEGGWIRTKDPIAITENTFGTDRFNKMFYHFVETMYGEDSKKACIVGGVRCEESPARRVTLTSLASYKHVTWAADRGCTYTMYPIYDWSYSDVWAAIEKNHWRYNKIYDEMYRRGVPASDMRVSNLNHETAVRNLYYVQEIEPKTWNLIARRVDGIDTTAKIDYQDNFRCPRELPFMFTDWREYRDYLLEHLVQKEETRQKYKKKFADMDRLYTGSEKTNQSMIRTQISAILSDDTEFTKVGNWIQQNGSYVRKARKGIIGIDEI